MNVQMIKMESVSRGKKNQAQHWRVTEQSKERILLDPQQCVREETPNILLDLI